MFTLSLIQLCLFAAFIVGLIIIVCLLTHRLVSVQRNYTVTVNNLLDINQKLTTSVGEFLNKKQPKPSPSMPYPTPYPDGMIPFNPPMGMPDLIAYQCIKKVGAAIIEAIKEQGEEYLIFFKNERGLQPNRSIAVSKAWVDKHTPDVGGVFVVYQDGYTSYSPIEAFAAGYIPVNRPVPVNGFGHRHQSWGVWEPPVFNNDMYKSGR